MKIGATELSALLQTMIEAALAAGSEIEAIYGAGCATEVKADGSPVTEADRRAEKIILERLRAAYPDIPVLAEEEACEGCSPTVEDRFFCVDPLDGTKGFVKRTGEFTVNIALVEEGSPVAGVIYAPDQRLLYYGGVGKGAFRKWEADAPEPIRARAPAATALVAVGSRDHHAEGTEERNRLLAITDYVRSGSSLKFCVLAEGGADIYPRYGPTMEWDTAAGQAILEAAGGRVVALENGEERGPLRYGKAAEGFLNPHFIARGAGA